ncbi:hypothetical protein DL546_008809 [Coniochaeta pulveracea]|uniref:Uncharacterized protein n=1 Tax=Coniochaeta pulveracea TaxID=177199 RepID=A0A420YKD5_9PEZI|nr:hypothetical protein DL546_008809 [Coniochaeta pulveracea]
MGVTQLRCCLPHHIQAVGSASSNCLPVGPARFWDALFTYEQKQFATANGAMICRSNLTLSIVHFDHSWIGVPKPLALNMDRLVSGLLASPLTRFKRQPNLCLVYLGTANYMYTISGFPAPPDD